MKVVTLKFWISNNQTVKKEMGPMYYDSLYDIPKVTSFKKIDEKLNDVLLDIDTKEHRFVKDIKINDVVVHQHNDGGSYTILRTYTIIY